MKKKFSLIFLFLTPLISLFGQGGTPTNIRGVGTFLGYNGGAPPGPLDIRNDFLTPNASIRFYTGGIPTNFNQRMVINPNIPAQLTTVPAGPQNTSGFVGVGLNPALQAPWSRLHIGIPAGPYANAPFGGYRAWMREGVTIQSADDQLWLGHRQWGVNPEQQNAMINWGDDGAGPAGTDHMVFNFTGTTFGGPYPAPPIIPASTTSLGLDVLRLTNLGLVGIGPRFDNNFPPQNTLHQHQENSSPSYFQISNQASPIFGNPPTALIGPTPITPNDGLKLGIDGPNNGYLVNQENRPLLFGANAAERMRIMNITNLTAPFPLNPGLLPGDATRVSISHNPATPLTRPLSLLHMGYNTGSILGPATTDGWRSWMDVGMLITRETDNVYLGLKPEPGGIFGQNRQDAVLSWGDDLANVPGNVGPDRFRIIFTTFTTAAAPVVMTSQNGLEFARFTPNLLNNNTVADPRVGFGDFQSMGNLDPNNTIEINTPLGAPPLSLGAGVNAPFIPGSWPGSTGASGLRFRDLTSLSVPVPTAAYTAATINPTHVLTVDGNGDIVKIVPTASVQTNNGISTTSLGVVQLGIDCPSPSPSITTAFQLINDRQIPMNNFNFTFSNTIGGFVPGDNCVGIGSSCLPQNRLEVDRNTGLAFTSGLRLSQFAVGAPTVAAFQNRVLSVDANGDVILSPMTPTVPPGGGVGNYCSQAPNPLTGEYEVPLGSFKYRFTGQGIIAPAPGGPQQDQVSIGYPCNSGLPVAKFCVKDSQAVANVPFDNYSAHFRNRNSAPAVNQSIITGGVYGEAMRPVAGLGGMLIPLNIGGVFQGGGAFGNTGVLGRTSGISTPTLNAAVGPFMIGGAFRSDSTTANYVNYGVHAVAKKLSSFKFWCLC